MEKNKTLTKYKNFKFQNHFNSHVNKLLQHLYPNAVIQDTKITFTSGPFGGLSCGIYGKAIYPGLSDEFINKFPRFKKNGFHSFVELVNTGFKWTGSSGCGYMYPLDRNMFDDSELGMEQKAVFFVMVMQVCLNWIISEENKV